MRRRKKKAAKRRSNLLHTAVNGLRVLRRSGAVFLRRDHTRRTNEPFRFGQMSFLLSFFLRPHAPLIFRSAWSGTSRSEWSFFSMRLRASSVKLETSRFSTLHVTVWRRRAPWCWMLGRPLVSSMSGSWRSGMRRPSPFAVCKLGSRRASCVAISCSGVVPRFRSMWNSLLCGPQVSSPASACPTFHRVHHVCVLALFARYRPSMCSSFECFLSVRRNM